MTAIFSYFNKPYSWKNLSILFLAAFLIRAAVFFFYIQHNERYCQADSNDYHTCATAMSYGFGMYRLDNFKPIFWRTPGYPAYLKPFYSYHQSTDPRFNAHMPAQKMAIWFQILLCSLTPILTFFLALSLTGSLSLAWIVGWIFVFHFGFVLASCYLLTDALAILFFFAFLLFFYKSFRLYGESTTPPKEIFFSLAIAALSLAGYTWMRPNGEFVAIMAATILVFSMCSLKQKAKKIGLFLLIFFTAIGGWYIRNYNLTGKWFFCPMSGPYMQAFIAPKIIRSATGKSFDQCSRYLMYQLKIETERQEELIKSIAPGKVYPREFACGPLAWPWVYRYPHYFVKEWLQEVCKTTFDLYGSQLVAFANNSYKYDPPEEFLPEKLKLCLYKQPMNFLMRLLCWIELLFNMLIWLGILGGLWIFLLKPLRESIRSPQFTQTGFLWIKTGLLIGGLLIMTGGFGYARLRMPAEPLLIILSLTFWYWFMYNKTEEKNT